MGSRGNQVVDPLSSLLFVLFIHDNHMSVTLGSRILRGTSFAAKFSRKLDVRYERHVRLLATVFGQINDVNTSVVAGSSAKTSPFGWSTHCSLRKTSFSKPGVTDATILGYCDVAIETSEHVLIKDG